MIGGATGVHRLDDLAVVDALEITEAMPRLLRDQESADRDCSVGEAAARSRRSAGAPTTPLIHRAGSGVELRPPLTSLRRATPRTSADRWRWSWSSEAEALPSSAVPRIHSVPSAAPASDQRLSACLSTARICLSAASLTEERSGAPSWKLTSNWATAR